MRKINENDYVDFTITGPGWSFDCCHVQKGGWRMERYNPRRMHFVRQQARRNTGNH